MSQTTDGGGPGQGSMCSINIEQMQALVQQFEGADRLLPGDKSSADRLLTSAQLSTAPTSGVPAISSWIHDQLMPLRRRLAIAQDLAASSPGAGLVQFDESLVPTTTQAQVDQAVQQAKDLLKDPDPKNLATLNQLLAQNGMDPYFASALAKATTPEDYEKFVKAIGPTGGYTNEKGILTDAKYPDGSDFTQYQTFLSRLGATLGQATRGTGDLALPSSWTKNFVQLMVNPWDAPGQNLEDDEHMADLWWGRSVLAALMSRGSFSTPFLKEATQQVAKVNADWTTAHHFLPDGTPMPPIPVDTSRAFAVVGANGGVFADPVIALMGALAQNPEAANWAFTQGGTTDFPLPMDGKDKTVPVNSFMAKIFTDHQWANPDDAKVVMVAIRAGAYFNPDSGIGTSINNFIESQKQQKEKWDTTPWYEKWGHLILDGLSLLALLIPVPGVDLLVSGGLQAANAAWYGVEGDWLNAGLSAGGAVFAGFGAMGPLRGAADAAQVAGKVAMLDRFGNVIDDGALGYKALEGAQQLEPGVFRFADSASMKAAIEAGQPNVTLQFGDLKYVTDADGALSSVQIYSKGAWVDGPTTAFTSASQAARDQAITLSEQFAKNGIEPGASGQFWKQYFEVSPERRDLVAGMKPEDQAALAKAVENGGVSLGHGNEKSIWGAIGEQRGFDQVLSEGEQALVPPGNVNANGPDFVTLRTDAESGEMEIVVWDAKYTATTYTKPFPTGTVQRDKYIAYTRQWLADYDGPNAAAIKELLRDDKNFKFELMPFVKDR